MPVKDPDGGLTFQGYDPRLFTGKLPVDQTATKPFYFGGSEVPTDLGIHGSGMRQQTPIGAKSTNPLITSRVHKLPSVRK
jgi:hypothetical protein